MTIVGEAFVAVSPVTTGFEKELTSQVEGSSVAGSLEKQFAQAGVLSGNEFGEKFKKQLGAAGIENTGALFGGALAVGATAVLAEIGEQFDKERKQIQEETGATGAALTGLANTATEAFRKVPTSLHDAASAVDELFKRGVPLGPQLDALAQQELFLAKITKQELGATVESTTGIFQKFGTATSDQSRELDVLFKASQVSGQSITVLTGALLSGASTLQSFGFNLDQSTALIAGLEKASVNVGPALAGLRKAFGQIASEGGDPKQVLADLLTEFTDGTPKAKALADAIQLFGKRSGTELATAIAKGKFSVDGLLKTITDGKGGIVSTGLATLTLGDQFKLLRNNIEADLAGIGTEVLHDLESTLEDLGTPIEHVITEFANLAVDVAPAAAALAVVLVPIKLLPPLIDDLANGLHVIDDVASALPTPVLAVAGALGIATFALRGLGVEAVTTTAGLELLGEAAEATFLALATNPIVLVTGAIIGLGAAFASLHARSAGVDKEAASIGDALFEAGQKGGIFKDGIDSATKGLASFLRTEADAGDLGKNITSALTDSGSTVQTLAAKLTGGTEAWKQYRDQLVFIASSGDPISLQSRQLSNDLDDQRTAFTKAAQTQLANLAITHQLTLAQEKHAIAVNTSKDGEVDYAGALNTANAALAVHVQRHNAAVIATDKTSDAEAKLAAQLASGKITDDQAKTALGSLGLTGDAVTEQLNKLKAKAVELNQVQDLAAGKSVVTTAAYGNLARAIATGSVAESDAELALQKMGFSADGAKAAFGDLQGQIKSFVDGALQQLPTVASVISDLSSDKGTDNSKLQSDLATRTSLYQQAAKAGGKASKDLRDQISKNNADIAADEHKLAIDQDPLTFAKNIITSAAQIATFQSNLQKLVSEGFGNLAGVLAAQGPKAAGALATALASSPAKAKVAAGAADLAKQTTEKYQTFLEQNFPQLTQAGKAAGDAVGVGIADGLTKELIKQFPQLKAIGVGIGNTVGDAVGPAIAKAVPDSLPSTLRTALRAPGEEISQGLLDGLAAGLTGTALAAYLKVVHTVGKETILALKNDWVIKSPSRVAADLGAQFGAGLAAGLSGSTDGVTSAASDLATSATAATEQITKALALPEAKTLSVSVVPTIEQVPSVPTLSAALRLTPSVDPLPAFTSSVDLTPNVGVVPALTAALHLTPELGAVPLVPAQSFVATPNVSPVGPLTAALNLTATVPDVGPLPALALHLVPDVAPVPDLTGALALTPHIGPLTVPAQSFVATPTVGPVAALSSTLRLTPEVGAVPSLSAALRLTPQLRAVPPIPDVAFRATPQVGALPAQSFIAIPLVGEIPEQSFAAVARVHAIPQLSAALALTPQVGAIPTLPATSFVATPQVGAIGDLESDLVLHALVPEIPVQHADLAFTLPKHPPAFGPVTLPIEIAPVGGTGSGSNFEKLGKLIGTLPTAPIAKDQPTPHLSIEQAGLVLPGTQRLDAIEQQRAVQPPSAHGNDPQGLFAGATFQFPVGVEPLHVANDIAWLVKHGLS